MAMTRETYWKRILMRVLEDVKMLEHGDLTLVEALVKRLLEEKDVSRR